ENAIENDPVSGELRVLFDLDCFQLTERSSSKLDSLYESIFSANAKLNIDISGHTDIRGGQNHNLKLSVQRAKSVYDYLLGRGIREDDMIMQGFGSSKLLDSNQTEKAHRKNRRVEIQYSLKP
ncbi:MAG: OmpA family protein, partial [Thiotrichales bacterium]|nr:OmpA family protein [Thiotrichales bacterium]